MAEIDIFRTYPAPKESWRSCAVRLDGKVVARLGGGGYKKVIASPGKHSISVGKSGFEGENLPIVVVDGVPTQILVGLGISNPNRPISDSNNPRRFGIKECSDSDDLPRCAIPLHSPGGLPHTLRQGQVKAVVALLALGGFSLLALLAGVVLMALGVSGGDPFRVVCGLVVTSIPALLCWKLARGVRLVVNQRHWPMEAWRVNDKITAQDEWKRWGARTGLEVIEAAS